MGGQGEGHLQAGGQQGGVQAVGDAQEQARHELWDDGPSPQVNIIPDIQTLRTKHSLPCCLTMYSKILLETFLVWRNDLSHPVQVLLPEGHPCQGGRTETRLSVCRCPQDRRHCWGGVHRRLSRDGQILTRTILPDASSETESREREITTN